MPMLEMSDSSYSLSGIDFNGNVFYVHSVYCTNHLQDPNDYFLQAYNNGQLVWSYPLTHLQETDSQGRNWYQTDEIKTFTNWIKFKYYIMLRKTYPPAHNELYYWYNVRLDADTGSTVWSTRSLDNYHPDRNADYLQQQIQTDDYFYTYVQGNLRKRSWATGQCVATLPLTSSMVSFNLLYPNGDVQLVYCDQATNTTKFYGPSSVKFSFTGYGSAGWIYPYIETNGDFYVNYNGVTKRSGIDGTVIWYNSSASYVLAWDANYIYSASTTSNQTFYKINKATGEIIGTSTYSGLQCGYLSSVLLPIV
jgi:hypothetical protein